jgi:hypothetical protein
MQVRDLLVVPERADGGQRSQAAKLQRTLEHLDRPGGAKQHDDIACGRLSARHELGDALGEQLRLGLAPGLGIWQPRAHATRDLPLLPTASTRQQQLDAGSTGAVLGAFRVGQQRDEVTQPLLEDAVHDVQQRCPAAVVAGQRKRLAGGGQRGPALPEQLHVGVAEPVDRLELVADREQVVPLQRCEDRELARVRVLELVDHQQREPLRPRLADTCVLVEHASREQLQVVEVDGRPIVLQPRVARGVCREQPVEQRHARDRCPSQPVAVRLRGIERRDG